VTTLKLHYDGWLALPAGLRQKLGLESGDRLEAELVGGTVVLRPAAQARRQTEPETQAGEPPAAAAPAAPPVEAIAPAKRRPKRPKDQAVQPGADRVPDTPDEPQPPAKRKPGRSRTVCVAEEAEAMPLRWRLLAVPRGSGSTRATSGRSATRFAMSRCASSDRGAGTTDHGSGRDAERERAYRLAAPEG
jgi:AbrB family looped-hinge helix DNA binding protein